MKKQTIQTHSRNLEGIPGLQRFLLILLIVAIQLIYFPTSEQLSGGVEPRLPIDVFPILPVWVLPYVLCYPLWIAGLIWATLKMENDLFRAFLAATLLTFTIAISIFIFFPTYVGEATLYGNDVFTNLLRSIHEDWGRYNALPSGHIYITVLLALFYQRWYPHLRNLWRVITVIVALSTLFTGQHYFADVLAGLLIAYGGYYFGSLWAGISALKRS